MAPAKPGAGESINEVGTSDITTQFLQDPRWAKVFIPTITHAFYVTHEPFLDWTPESAAFLTKVQCVFDLAFPNVTLVLTDDGAIVNTVSYLLHLMLIDMFTK
jgi:hypothetical protein